MENHLRSMSEAEFDSFLISKLEGKFDITSQKKSLSGDSRFDLFIRHKEYKWLVFGIENKKPVDKKKGSLLANWIKQVAKYSREKWFEFGQVFEDVPWMINGVSERSFAFLNEGKQTHTLSHTHSNVNSLIFVLSGVGELDIYEINGYEVIRFRFNNISIYNSRTFKDGSVYEIASENNYNDIKRQIAKIQQP